MGEGEKCSAHRDREGETLTTLTTLTSPRGMIGRLLVAARRRRPEPAAPPVSDEPSTESLLDLTYEGFAKADLIVRIDSGLLGGEICLASDEQAAAWCAEGAVVFLLDEIGHLYAGGTLCEDALRLLYRLKRAVPGGARITGTYGFKHSRGEPWQ